MDQIITNSSVSPVPEEMEGRKDNYMGIKSALDHPQNTSPMDHTSEGALDTGSQPRSKASNTEQTEPGRTSCQWLKDKEPKGN